MSLIEKIKAQQLQARKNKNAIEASLLTTLIGEAVIIGKNDGNRETTDAEVIAVVKKFIKNTNEMLTALNNSTGDALTESREIANAELQILNSFLPKQLSEEELKAVVDEIIADMRSRSSGVVNMGMIMGALKLAYDGQYDGKMASSVVKAALAS